MTPPGPTGTLATAATSSAGAPSSGEESQQVPLEGGVEGGINQRVTHRVAESQDLNHTDQEKLRVKIKLQLTCVSRTDMQGKL